MLSAPSRLDSRHGAFCVRGAFTFETIIVICVVAILILIVVGGMSSMFVGSALSSAEFTLRQTVRSAQQLAMTRNTLVTLVAEEGVMTLSPAHAPTESRTVNLPAKIVFEKKLTLVFHPVGTVTSDRESFVLRHRNSSDDRNRISYRITASGQVSAL